MSDSTTMIVATGAPAERVDLEQLAEVWRLGLGPEDLDVVTELAARLIGDAAGVAALAPPQPAAPGRRDPGRRPTPDDDPYNAFVRVCDVALDEADGLLAGLRIALKDCIAVAGVPLTGGSALLEGFVPSADSTLAARVLEGGGRIVGMANMDCLAWSGYGDTSVHGATRNPFDLGRTAGGSSGGSAAAVWLDGVDGSFGCDQGGSVRLPAAFCGAVGLKPTHGVIPYTRILGIDMAVDHAGPIAREVDIVARLLDATAGLDGVDPRQPRDLPTTLPSAVRAVREAPDDLRGVTIAVVREGLDGDAVGVTEEVRDAFLAAVDRVAGLGAEIREVSIPEQLTGGAIDLAGCVEGMLSLLTGGANGYQWQGAYWPELAAFVAQHLPDRAADLSIHVKLIILCAETLRRRNGGATYGTARNLHAQVRRSYDAALAGVDALALPTTPWLAHEIENDLSRPERIMKGWGVTANTAPTDVSGHPAISLPIAEADGLPVGVMLVGPRFGEDRLLRLARTIEGAHGWRPAGGPR